MTTVPPPRDAWLRKAYGTGALFLIALGLSVLIGWLTDRPSLLFWLAPGEELKPAPSPVNGALGFALFGLAFLLQAYRNRLWSALAIVPAAAGVLTLQQFYLNSTLGFDEWLLPQGRFDGGVAPGRLPPGLAVSFILSGFAISALVIGRAVQHRPLALAAIGSCVCAIGFAEIAGHLTELKPATTLGFSMPVPLPMAMGTLVLGAVTVMLGVLDRPRSLLTPPRWIPVALMIGCATATTIYWVALRAREHKFRRDTLRYSADNLAFAFNSELDAQLKALSRTAAREGFGDEYPERLREADALAIVRDFPSVSYVAWLDASFKTRRLFPVEGNELSLGLDHGSDPTRRLGLERAKQQRRGVVCGPLLPRLGQPVFMLYSPVVRRDVVTGYLAAEVRGAALIAALKSQLSIASDDTVAVSVGEIRIFGTEPDPAVREERDTFDDVYNSELIRSRIVLSRQPRTGVRDWFTLSNIVFAAGLGVSALVGLVVGLAQQARHRQRTAEETSQKLERENHERRQVEGKLKLSEERLTLALESSQVGVFDWNVATGKVHFSPGTWIMLGYQPGAMAPLLKAWDELIHPADRGQVRRDFRRSATSGSGHVEAEYRMRARFGEWLWILERSKCVSYAPDGMPLRVTGTYQDITKRKQAEEALQASQTEARKLAIVASITDNLVIITDAAGRIEWVNESFSRLFDYSLGEVAGRSILDYLAGAGATSEQAAELSTTLESRLPYTSEIVAASRTQQQFHLHLELQPAANDEGVVEKYIAVLYDITARLDTERALRRATAEAEATTRAKSEFLASMSHEIRTPMNGVIALTRLLLESPLNAEQQDWVRTIQSSGDALLTIINDILDFSKIESGRLEIEKHPFVIADCLEEALELFAMPASSKGIELAYTIAPEIATQVVGDVTRLRQVVMNLVGNAVKFTPQGEVSVEVQAGEEPDVIHFSVSDTGIGIPDERVPHLFQPFHQVDSSITRKYGGTGLGLAICKRLVELMGGSINLTSHVGEGTIFQFTIRAPAVAPTPATTPATATPGAGRTALVVDDNPVVRRFLSIELAREGFAVRAASDAAAAHAALQSGVKPDLFCIDLELPDANGLKAAADLQNQLGPTTAPFLLLCRAGQTPAAGQLAAADIRGSLIKPLRRQSVRDRLYEALQNRGPGVAAQPAQVTTLDPSVRIAESIPLRILLAEDNPVNKKVALRLLERLGYTADAVVNGAEALRAVEAGTYQLVFMDVQMPEMDGLEATRRIRSSLPAERQPVIVALTANALAGDQQLCRDAGMDDYVTKPVRPEDIHNAIIRRFGQGTGIPLQSGN